MAQHGVSRAVAANSTPIRAVFYQRASPAHQNISSCWYRFQAIPDWPPFHRLDGLAIHSMPISHTSIDSYVVDREARHSRFSPAPWLRSVKADTIRVSAISANV
jgi:hypothetical protein